jgi:hypothetical protein
VTTGSRGGSAGAGRGGRLQPAWADQAQPTFEFWARDYGLYHPHLIGGSPGCGLLNAALEHEFSDWVLAVYWHRGWRVRMSADIRPQPTKGDNGFTDMVATRGGEMHLAELKAHEGWKRDGCPELTGRPEQAAWRQDLLQVEHRNLTVRYFLWQPRDAWQVLEASA